MAVHNEFGKEAEKEVVKFLINLNYKILETNWRYLKAEVDIIALQGNELIIVEVKARSNDEVISPEEAVTLSKKKLLIMAADHYVIRNNLNLDVRFDIVSVLKRGSKWDIKHIEDAFNVLL